MGWFSSICSSISSGIRSVCSGISSVCSSISRGISAAVDKISGLCSSIGPALSVISKIVACIPGCQGLAAVMGTIGRIATVIAVITGVFRQDERVEDIGERALQAEEQGITLKSCNGDFKAYMEKVRNLKLDPDKMHEKNEQIMAGCMVAEQGIREANPKLSTVSLYPLAMFSDLCSADRLKKWAETAQRMDMPLSSIAKFYLGSTVFNAIFPEEGKKANAMDGRKAAVAAEKELHPDLNKNAINDDIDKTKKNIEDILKHAAENYKE